MDHAVWDYLKLTVGDFHTAKQKALPPDESGLHQWHSVWHRYSQVVCRCATFTASPAAQAASGLHTTHTYSLTFVFAVGGGHKAEREVPEPSLLKLIERRKSSSCPRGD